MTKTKKTEDVIYGFVDESGTTGVVRGEDNFLVASIVLFRKQNDGVDETFNALRKKLGLKKNYEFHSSHNSERVRKEVLKTITKLDFQFMTFAIEKDNLKRRASYGNLAEMMVRALKDKFGGKMEIAIDTNPNFLKELNRAKKKIGYRTIYFREAESDSDNRIQLVDYIVNMHSKAIKGDAAEQKRLSRAKDKMLAEIVERV